MFTQVVKEDEGVDKVLRVLEPKLWSEVYLCPLLVYSFSLAAAKNSIPSG